MADWIPGFTLPRVSLPNIYVPLLPPYSPWNVNIPLLPPTVGPIFKALHIPSTDTMQLMTISRYSAGGWKIYTPQKYVAKTTAPPLPALHGFPNPFAWFTGVETWLKKYWPLILIAIAAIVLLYAYLGRTSVKTTVVVPNAPK